MIFKSALFFFIILQSLFIHAEYTKSTSNEKAILYFISPFNGQILQNPVKVLFGLSGMGVAPAGVDKENTGHHHLLVDAKKLPDLDKPLPSDGMHIHYGGGQTESLLVLAPGKHSLQLILGDKYHIPHNPPVISKKVFITIK